MSSITSPRRATLDELYRAHAPKARRLAYLLTGDKEVAADLTQDAFVRVMGRLTHIRDADAFGSYLRRSVINLTRMRFRRGKVEARYLETESRALADHHEDADVPELDLLRRSLLKLPYRQRAAVALRYYQALTDHEIADLLGCAEATVRSLVSRGLTSLRSDMEGQRHG